jgi:hypothetical protein
LRRLRITFWIDVELGITFGEEWYDHFGQEYIDSMLPNEVAKIGTWAKRMLSILEGMGKKLGYSVSIEKPIRVDMAWFDRRYFERSIGVLPPEVRAYFCA